MRRALLRSPRLERCPSGRRNATGNRVPAERWVEGSNPSLSASLSGAGLRPPPRAADRLPATGRAAQHCPARIQALSDASGNRRMRSMKVRIGRREVNVSNPDKIFFPKRKLRKIDLVEYYLDVADCVLNHVQRRPMQMKRYPDGAEEWFFYQKRVPANHPDWLETVHIKFPSGRTADFPVANEPARARLDRQPRLHRPAHLALARRRRRPARLPADRPRPERGQPLAARAQDRTRREGRDGRARAGELSEDIGLDWASTSWRRSSRSSASPRSGVSRRRWPRRSSAGSTIRRSRRRLGKSRTGSACSSTTARIPATGRSRPRTRSARRPMPEPRRRSSGTRWRR